MSIPGAFLFVLLAILRIPLVLRGRAPILGILLVAQSALAAILLIVRRPDRSSVPAWVQLGAWGSAVLPLFLSTAAAAPWQGVLPGAGLALNVWALGTLGASFGIAPGRRGLVTRGPYRAVRHPMYAGELLSIAGAVLAVPSRMNLLLLALFTATILWRIQQEEAILRADGYPAYAVRVRFRLVPGIW